MKRLLSVLLFFTAVSLGQVFPGAIATDADLLVAKNRASGTLRTTVNASATTIVLVAGQGTRFAAYVPLTIGTEDIVCTTLATDTFSGCTRGFGGSTAAAHSAGAIVNGFIIAAHLTSLRLEIEAIETALGINLGNIGTGGGSGCTPPSGTVGQILVYAAGGDCTASSATVSGSAITGSLVGNASTATALAANGANCTGNNFALGVDASGVAECAQPAFTNISGSVTDAQVPNNITIDLATAATALAANGANCGAGSFPLGVDASGAAESCTALPTSLTGTANQISVSASTGAITISIPSSPTLPGTTTGTFSGNITGTVTGHSSLDCALTGCTMSGQFVTANLGIEFTESDTNPSCASGNFTIYADLSENKLKKCQNGNATDLDTTGGSPSFDQITGATNSTAAMVVGTGASLSTSGSGAIAATTAAALAANGANCSSGNFPLGVDAAGAVENCTALPTTISGTANQITASAATGAITLSIPTNPTLPGTTTGTFSGNLTGNVTGNADTATKSPVFAGSTATAPAHSATPTFSLAAVSNTSPLRIEPGAMTANVTSVTFTNKTAGAKFSIAWTQDGTGGRTVTYGASATGGCAVDPTASATTTQFFEVGSDGSTVYGVGCKLSADVIRGPEASAPGTPPASTFVIWGDSTNHILSYKANNSATVSNTVVPDTGTANNYISAISALGVISKSRPACATLSDAASTCNSNALSALATQAADTVVMNATGSTAVPTAKAMPTGGTNGCAGASDALTYNTSTHALGCNQISGGSSCTILASSGDYMVPGQGFAISAYPPSSNDTVAFSPGSANRVVAVKVYIPCAFTPNSISFYITTQGSGSCRASVGLYNSAGTKVVSSGTLTNATTVACNTAGAKVLTSGTSPAATGMGSSYPAGFYYVATVSNETTGIVSAATVEGEKSTLLNAAATQIGYNDGTATNGDLPSTLPSLTATGLSAATVVLVN